MGHRASALDETDLVSLFSNSEWIIEMKSVKLDDRPEGFNLARMTQLPLTAMKVDGCAEP